VKSILVLYYSQSGQLKSISDNLLKNFSSDQYQIVYEEIRPKKAFPFPWKPLLTFFDAFAESVNNTSCELEPFNFDTNQKFDLVILPYQVWYLNPSIPFFSALKSPAVKTLIKDSPVITLIGCRNMWVMAQEKVKTEIKAVQGQLIGNIVLADKAPNVVGAATIAYWLLTGKKEKMLGFFPKPGISKEDIEASYVFGDIIRKHLEQNQLENLQEELVEKQAISLKSSLILFESRILRIFKIWAKFIAKSGGPNHPKRQPKLILFIIYLIIAILVLAPLVKVLTFIQTLVQRKKLSKELEYYKSVNLFNNL
jgi:hypothetical protein